MKWSIGWPAPAKINLFLLVLGRREDGYHLLQTAFQFLNHCDWIDFEVLDQSEIRRKKPILGVSQNDDLVIRAAHALKTAAQYSGGVSISVDKQLPIGSGLGGGSSDAATVLVALNELWQINFSVDVLAELGLSLGADVPVFVRGNAAWGEGVGELLEPMEFDETPIVVVTPDCCVDTKKVFEANDLTRDSVAIKMHHLLECTRNDCEAVRRKLYPPVGDAIEWLGKYGLARMSGTGASVFAFFETVEEAESVATRKPQQWTAFSGYRLNRSPLLSRLADYRNSL